MLYPQNLSPDWNLLHVIVKEFFPLWIFWHQTRWDFQLKAFSHSAFAAVFSSVNLMIKKSGFPHKGITICIALIGSFPLMHMLMVIKSRTPPDIFFTWVTQIYFLTTTNSLMCKKKKRIKSNQKLFHIHYNQVLFLHSDFSEAE